jgi:hypothetical protein
MQGSEKKWVLGKKVQVVNQPLAASAQREAAGSGLAAGEARDDHSPATQSFIQGFCQGRL